MQSLKEYNCDILGLWFTVLLQFLFVHPVVLKMKMTTVQLFWGCHVPTVQGTLGTNMVSGIW